MTDNHTHTHKVISSKQLPDSEVEIAVEIPETAFAKWKTNSAEEMRKEFVLPGFRKGSVPLALMTEKIGAGTLLREAAEEAINHTIPHTLEEQNIHPIETPRVTITALAETGVLAFTLRIATVPTVALPDYKAIAKKENGAKETAAEVSEQEIRDAIAAIEKQIGESAPEKAFSLTDETVKKLGAFENLADFTEKLKTQMLAEKQTRAKEKKRLALLKKISEATPIALPHALVRYELGKMRAQLEANLKQMGQTFESYAKHAKKTAEEVEKEWTPDARERAKEELILHHLALAEKISPDVETVEREVKHILEHYKEADPERARAYVENMLVNEKVFQFLEQQ